MVHKWKPISSHPRDGRMFIAINARTGIDSLRVVVYDEGDDCYGVVGRDEVWAPGLFTHWFVEVPDLTYEFEPGPEIHASARTRADE